MQTHEASRTASGAGDPSVLARGLGWFSVGLGIAELAAPRALARAIGVEERGGTPAAIRALGARELVSGLGILARPRRALPLWARVAGDAVDLAFLAWALGAKRRSTQRLVGAIAAVAGVTALDVVASRRAQRAQRAGERPVVRAITIHRPPSEVYAFWRDFDEHPRFMKHLVSVTEQPDGITRWVAKLPVGGTVAWEAEVIEDRPSERIAWRSLRGARIPNRGSVTLRPILGGEATEVRVELQVSAPGAAIGAAIAKLFAGPLLAGDLRRMKQILETGEVVLSDASLHAGPHPARPAGEVGGAP